MQSSISPPPPQDGGEAAEFWRAASERRLLLKRCRKCHEVHYFPRTLCPFCFSEQTDWFEACGRGSIYTLTFNRRVAPCEVIAFVTLEEGVTMMTHIVGANAEDAVIGAAVVLDFMSRDGGQQVPVFRLTSHKGATAP